MLSPSSTVLSGEFDLAEHGHDSCDVLLDDLKGHRIVELVDCVLETQVEKLILKLGELFIQISD